MLAQEPTPENQKAKNDNAPDEESENQQVPDRIYAEPSVPGRDKRLLGERGGKPYDFRYSAEVLGIYDSGLTPVSTNAGVQPVNNGAASGVETGFGVTGSVRRKRDTLSLEYKGAYRQYSTNNVAQGLDQFLNLAYSRELKRRLVLDLKETAGTVSLANGAFSYLPLSSTDLFAVPSNELFDIRTKFAQSRVDLTWDQSARLSFTAGGQGFVVRRSSFALAGLDGYDAHAAVAYLLTRHQSLSADYSYTFYDFQRTFGNATLQTAALGYSLALSRRWDLTLRGGGVRIGALGIAQVPIDPAIAAIVGRNYANVSVSRVLYAPLAEARLNGRFNRSSLTFGYSRGVAPGNGVYLTSQQNVGSAMYSYTGYRRWALGLNAGYNDLSSVGQNLGKYTNLQGGAAVSYKLAPDTHIQFRYDYRHYTAQNSFYKKDSNRVSLGLAFSPGETPMAIW